METGSPKDVVWIASTLNDLKEFPESVRQTMGFAIARLRMAGQIHEARSGRKEGV